MPPTPEHLQTSLSRTGKDYAALHAWIDDPVLKAERHDFTRMLDYADRIVDIIWDGIEKVSSQQDAEDRFMAILEGNIKYGKNAQTLERYRGYHNEIQNLMKATS